MTAADWRYVALIAGTMLGGAILLGILVHPALSAAYVVAFYAGYMNYPWLHRTAERISKGKEKRPE